MILDSGLGEDSTMATRAIGYAQGMAFLRCVRAAIVSQAASGVVCCAAQRDGSRLRLRWWGRADRLAAALRRRCVEAGNASEESLLAFVARVVASPTVVLLDCCACAPHQPSFTLTSWSAALLPQKEFQQASRNFAKRQSTWCALELFASALHTAVLMRCIVSVRSA